MLLASACDEPGYAIVIRAHAADDGVLVADTYVSATVIDRQSRGAPAFESMRLPSDLGTAAPAELRVELNGGGQYDAHVLVVAPNGRWYATRCYQIGGSETSDVLLAGPLDFDADADGDGWAPDDVCQDPGGAACSDPCPAIRANDCNDHDPDINPGAEDVCQDQIDQNCSGTDALCGEDEAL